MYRLCSLGTLTYLMGLVPIRRSGCARMAMCASNPCRAHQRRPNLHTSSIRGKDVQDSDHCAALR
eukprot:16179-Eustigmatos_ZCMA.PRE.1